MIDLFTEQYKLADLVIEDENKVDTYVCYRRRQQYDGDAEDEACWRIILYRTSYDGETKITRALYPYGHDTYDFAPAKISEYKFEYAK
jgi:hypothetical protein